MLFYKTIIFIYGLCWIPSTWTSLILLEKQVLISDEKRFELLKVRLQTASTIKNVVESYTWLGVRTLEWTLTHTKLVLQLISTVNCNHNE